MEFASPSMALCLPTAYVPGWACISRIVISLLITQQAVRFAEALVRGRKDSAGVIETVLTDEVREVT